MSRAFHTVESRASSTTATGTPETGGWQVRLRATAYSTEANLSVGGRWDGVVLRSQGVDVTETFQLSGDYTWFPAASLAAFGTGYSDPGPVVATVSITGCIEVETPDASLSYDCVLDSQNTWRFTGSGQLVSPEERPQGDYELVVRDSDLAGVITAPGDFMQVNLEVGHPGRAGVYGGVDPDEIATLVFDTGTPVQHRNTAEVNHAFSKTNFGLLPVATGYDLDFVWTDPSSKPGFVNVAFVVCSGANEAPTAEANGPYLGAINTGIAFDGTGSSDPDGDLLTFDWDWGDTTTSADAGATPTHTYGAAGIYDVCVTVTDPAGASDESCTSAVVYDPDGGFVTGGGWFDSSEGAYTPDPSLTGRATFGFVAKYKKGQQTPDGTTGFEFETAGLDFSSTSYDWLVVTGNDSANFKGSGTVNDVDGYQFMLWAGDGDPDMFRIKIWTEDAGFETVVYDNGQGQAISGGNIVVHTKKK